MDLRTVYLGQTPLPEDILRTNLNTMSAIGRLIQALLGTNTVVEGFACTPDPSTMSVDCAPGSVMQLEDRLVNTYGTLPPDSTPIMKQGINWTSTNLPTPAPTTSGDSVIYGIQVSYQSQDSAPENTNFYNSANPGTPIVTAISRNRYGLANLQVVAGTPAPSPVAPGAGAGAVMLYYVTVPYGATSITAAMISLAPDAPFLTQSIFNLMNESGTVNVPALTASGLITANGGISVPSGETATIGGTLDVTGSVTIPNATASNNPVALGQFISTIAGSPTSAGYLKLPDGTLIQIGMINVLANNSATWTFPMSFTSGVAQVFITQNEQVPTGGSWGWANPTLTNVGIFNNNAGPANISLLAIGV